MVRKLGTVFVLVWSLLLSPAAVAFWGGQWLIGISGGFADFDDNIMHGTIQHPAPGMQSTNFENTLNDGGFLWGLLVGYQIKRDIWLFGAEVNVEWNDSDNSHFFAFTDALGTGWAATASYDRDATYGLTARLGYDAFKQFLPYVLLGVESSDDTLTFLGYNDSSALAVYATGDHNSYRIVSGFGVEIANPCLKQWSTRLEYNFHNGGKTIEIAALASDSATLFTVDSKVKTHSGKVSIVWKFA